ncbi:MAG: AAA family ATPase [Acidimicrobiaceae bacterium]|nr:AAA family ATPase [Acidimicrobiaceae bacterium]
MPSFPLRSIEVTNFKSIAHGKVDFRPLTVLVGQNSAGKSSLLQTLRFLSQTAATSKSGIEVPLNGTKLRLGTFDDVRTSGAEGSISVRANLSTAPHRTSDNDEVGSEVQLKIEAAPPEENPERGYAHLAVNDLEVSDSVALWCAEVWIQAVWSRVRETVLEAAGEQSCESFGHPGIGIDADWDSERQTECEDTDFYHPVDDREPVESWLRGWLLKKSGLDQYQNSSEPLSVDMSARQESLLLASSDDIRGAFETVYNLGSVDPSYRVKIIHDRVLRYSLDDMARLALSMIELGGLYFEDNPYHDKDDSDSWYVNPERLLMTDFTKIAHQLVSAIVDDEWTRDPSLRQWADSAVAERQRPAVANMLRDHVRYLGPLRQEPRPFFDIDDEDRLDVGAAGQHLARVLQWHGTRTVDVPELGKVDLVDGLQRWLRKLGVIDEVAVEARGRAGVSVEVRPPDLDRRVDLTSVGVGISQVLPVLVVCLLADPGDLVLLEQPELHLHPALQMRLADFLLACVESGRQIIVETHSENLVNRLRRRVAEDDTSDTAGLVRVVFAERNAEGHTTFRPSDINPMGGLSQDWPDGFLDLGARDAQKLLRAGLAKHRRLKSA